MLVDGWVGGWVWGVYHVRSHKQTAHRIATDGSQDPRQMSRRPGREGGSTCWESVRDEGAQKHGDITHGSEVRRDDGADAYGERGPGEPAGKLTKLQNTAGRHRFCFNCQIMFFCSLYSGGSPSLKDSRGLYSVNVFHRGVKVGHGANTVSYLGFY